MANQLREALNRERQRRMEQQGKPPQSPRLLEPYKKPQAGKPPQKGQPPQKKPKIVCGKPTIATFVCGHKVELPGPQEEFLDKWLKKRAKKLCPACQMEKQKKEMAEAHERRKLKPIKHPNKPWMCDKNAWLKGRLPNGSRYESEYFQEGDNERDGQWIGTLTVPVNGEKIKFTNKCGALHRGITLLDDQWRIYKEEHGLVQPVPITGVASTTFVENKVVEMEKNP